jgi:lipopolysaccharide biosynthesis regulator YciM
MDPIWLLLLLPFAAGSGWLGAARALAKKRQREVSLPSAYFKGLNFLLNEQHDKALEVLVTALEQDKETVEVQLALGSLFRKRGEIQRATRVHQNLVARTQLDDSQKLHALYELAQDYYKAGLLDRAEHLLVEIGGVDELEESAQQLLLQIYEQEKEWENAIKVAKNLEAFDGQSLSGVIAQYHCEIAENAITEGRYSFAQTRIREAIEVDGACVRAIIQSGRVRAIQGDHRGAVDEWVKGVDRHSELPGEITGLIQNSYRILGALDEYREFLKNMLKSHDDIRLVLALTECFDDWGGGEIAETFLLEKIRSNPSIPGLHRLIQMRLSQSNFPNNQDLGLLEKLIGGIVADESGYECRHCGFRGKVMHWQCPGCRTWNTTHSRYQRGKIPYVSNLVS